MALYDIKTKKEFEDKVLGSDKVVLVDFWAIWCPPCRAMAPILEETAKSQDDIADIVKVDIEASAENQALANEYGVRSIPNMLIFKDGQEVERFVGITPEKVLAESFKRHAE